MDERIEEIHRFWFGTLNAAGLCAPEHNKLWFAAGEDTDDTLRSRFGSCLEQAKSGALNSWAAGDRGLVALVVLLDQFSRNIYRGSAESFAADPAALALAQAAIDEGRHQQLPVIHRVFLYLPLEHCEDLAVQETCVRLFEELVQQSGQPEVENFARYAVAHRDAIAAFGRFPHRNEILGRPSTEQELAWLAEHGGF